MPSLEVHHLAASHLRILRAGPTGIAAIAAISRNGALGFHGKLPWDIPEDVAYFESMVAGAALVVGRLTYLTMPVVPVDTFVVTVAPDIPRESGAHRVASVEAGLRAALQTGKQVFVIGGAGIYEAAWPYCRYLFLTRIDGHFAGDAFFPPNIGFDRLPIRDDQVFSCRERCSSNMLACRFTCFEQALPQVLGC